MQAYLQPRWLIPAAIAAFVFGVVGLFVGLNEIGPMGIVVAEMLMVLAAAKLTSPDIDQASREPPKNRAESGGESTPSREEQDVG